jgi:hypothetical protein
MSKGENSCAIPQKYWLMMPESQNGKEIYFLVMNVRFLGDNW